MVTYGRVIAIGDIVPDLCIIPVVAFAYFDGQKEGMLLGLISGLLLDLYKFSLFGFSALVFVFAGFVAGSFKEKYEKNEILVPTACLLIFEFVYQFLSFSGNFFLQNRLNVGFYLSRFIIPEVIYTVVIFIVLYYPLNYIESLLSIKFRAKDKELYDENKL